MCYNSENTIERCIDSISAQTVLPDECVVVDGGSSDKTKQLIFDFHRSGNITKFVSEQDRGISHAFNKACALTESDYVCFLNSDDWVEPSHIANAKELLSIESYDIVISDIRFGDTHPAYVIRPSFPRRLPIKKWSHPRVNHPGMIIKKSLIEKLNGFDENYKVAMDIDFVLRALSHQPSIRLTNCSTVNQSDGGKSQSNWAQALSEVRQIEMQFGRPKLSSWFIFYFRYLKVMIKKQLWLLGR